MTPEQRAVEAFHRATGATIGDTPAIRDPKLRIDLIAEELEEFADACGYWPDGDTYEHRTGDNLVAAIDALCDLLYVVYGAAVTFGVDLEPFFKEVHRSNMTKVGGLVREDGKILKPDTYEPPNLEAILHPEGEWGIYCPAACGLIFETQFDLDEHLERVPAHGGADA